MLRAYTTDEEDDEKRAISVKLPSLESFSKVFKSSKTKELQKLIKKDESLGNAFKTLGLSKMKIGEDGLIQTKMVARFFSSSNFKIWSAYATRVNKQDPEGAMLTALTNVFDEKTVATMIVLGKDFWSSKSTAKKLETALFNKWYATDKLATADDALLKVLEVKRADIHRYPREKSIWVDYSTYITTRVKNY